MKLVAYKPKDSHVPYRVGFMIDKEQLMIADAQNSYEQYLFSRKQFSQVDDELPSEPDLFYKSGKEAMANAKKGFNYITENDNNNWGFVYSKDEVTLGPPIFNPGKIICVGRNYEKHAEEMKGNIPEIPVLFSKFSNAIIGPDDTIEKSSLTDKLDYEVELVVMIGKQASFVKREDAHTYIAGYTIGNDITARDLQKRTLQWLQGKTLDKTTPIGPWIVTGDELKRESDLNISTYVNDEKRQDGNTKDLIFDVPYLIEFISSLITLEPGDLIMTGTPDGVGVGMNPPNFLSDGDTVTSIIEGIGKMTNQVVDKR